MPEDKFAVLNQYPISSWEWPRPVVFIPWTRALSYADEVLPQIIEIARTGVQFIHQPAMFADRARNEAVKELLDSDYTHIVMLDEDHVHVPYIVQQLSRSVIEDPERHIVGGLNFKRSQPYRPCVLYINDGNIYSPHEWSAGVERVDSIGFGCVMIDRRVFEAVEWPWFINEPHYESQTLGSHDNYFCRKAIEAGFSVWCDYGLTSPHISTHRITERTYRTYNNRYPVSEEDIKDVEEVKA